MARKKLIPGKPIRLAAASAKGYSREWIPAEVDGFLSQRLPAIVVPIPDGYRRVQIHVDKAGKISVFKATGRVEEDVVIDPLTNGFPRGSIVEAWTSGPSDPAAQAIVTDVLKVGDTDLRDKPYAERLAIGQVGADFLRISDRTLPPVDKVFPEKLYGAPVTKVVLRPAGGVYPTTAAELNWLSLAKPKEVPVTKADILSTRAQILALMAGADVSEPPEDELAYTVLKADDEQRLVYGVVIRPNMIDGHLDTMSPEEVIKTAHYFMAVKGIMGVGHAEKAEAIPVESYIAPVDFMLGDGEVKAGDWVLVSYILDDELWSKVKSGVYNGYSPGGFANRKQI